MAPSTITGASPRIFKDLNSGVLAAPLKKSTFSGVHSKPDSSKVNAALYELPLSPKQ
jgi:hypothetical protein